MDMRNMSFVQTDTLLEIICLGGVITPQSNNGNGSSRHQEEYSGSFLSLIMVHLSGVTVVRLYYVMYNSSNLPIHSPQLFW